MKRRLGILCAALAAIAVIAGPALAGHVTGSVPSYTGCLVGGEGVIIKISQGNAPKSPCTGGQTQVHFSGGDVTAISAGTGLQGGGSEGAVTLSLAAGFRLPQGCGNGQVAKWSVNAWVCADDVNSTYSAGTGLELNGTQFSIDQPYRLPVASQGDSIIKGSGDTWTTEQFTRAGEDCPTGQFVRATSSSGGVTCAAPPQATGIAGYTTTGGFMDLGGTMDVLTLNLPAGNYLLFADVEFIQQDDDTGSAGSCVAGNGRMRVQIQANRDEVQSGSLTGAVSHAGGPISLRCTETSADVDIVRSDFHAIRLDTLN